jgi:hypothetical protein
MLSGYMTEYPTILGQNSNVVNTTMATPTTILEAWERDALFSSVGFAPVDEAVAAAAVATTSPIKLFHAAMLAVGAVYVPVADPDVPTTIPSGAGNASPASAGS